MNMINKMCPDPQCYNKTISWCPIIAGAIVAVGLIALFKLLTFGIGLSAVTRSDTGQLTLMVGGFIWLIIGSYITLFLAGWVTGVLARVPNLQACYGILSGFLMWSLALIICVFLESSAAGSMLFAFSKMFGYVKTNSDTVEHANKVGIATLSAFFSLLSGALGSCCGAYFGMKYCKHDYNKDNKPQSQPYQQ